MEALQSFFNYLNYEKRCSAHTFKAYSTDLRQFEAYLNQDEPIPIEKATYQQIRAWLIFLIDTGLNARSVNRKIAALSAFYRFLMKRGDIQEMPTRKLTRLKTRKQLPQFIDESELDRLFTHVAFPEGFEGQRDRVILELLYGTGMRASELLRLRVRDIDWQTATIMVFGKRNKARKIPLPAGVFAKLRQYCEQYPSASGLIVRTEEGKAGYPLLLYRIVRRYLQLTQSSDRKSPHVLRHTFATHLLNNGAELNAIKELLGHASLAATQVYTHNSLSRLKEIFDKAHPKA